MTYVTRIFAELFQSLTFQTLDRAPLADHPRAKTPSRCGQPLSKADSRIAAQHTGASALFSKRAHEMETDSII